VWAGRGFVRARTYRVAGGARIDVGRRHVWLPECGVAGYGGEAARERARRGELGLGGACSDVDDVVRRNVQVARAGGAAGGADRGARGGHRLSDRKSGRALLDVDARARAAVGREDQVAELAARRVVQVHQLVL
jgi:hypothetical protein